MAASRNSPPTEPLAAVAAALRRHLPQGARLVAGLSGGLDSVVLLDVLREAAPERQLRLSAVHVNHGLSPHADRWEAFCRDLCAGWGIPVEVARVTVRRGDSVEAAARRARHAAFERLGGLTVALGHHRSDQAETVLFNMLRGAGVRGAAGMPELRQLPGGTRLLRPLLAVPRSAILARARLRGLEWVEDESNADPSLTRNFLRLEVMPRLAARLPGCEAALAAAAARFAEAESLLDQLAAGDLSVSLDDSGGVPVAALVSLGEARARNLLRALLRRAGAPAVTAAWLAEALHQLCQARDDGGPVVAVAGWTLRRYRGVVHLVAGGHGAPSGHALPWRDEGSVAWGSGRVWFSPAQGHGLACRMIGAGDWWIRARAGGERMRLAPDRPARSLKNLLQEAGVPPWRREGMPLIYHGRMLAWVPGVGVALEYRCAAGEPGLVPHWETGGPDPTE